MSPTSSSHLGRWVDGAVFVLFGERGVRLAETIMALDLASPKLLALAATEQEADGLFTRLAQRHDHPNAPNLSSLEPGLALEV